MGTVVDRAVHRQLAGEQVLPRREELARIHTIQANEHGPGAQRLDGQRHGPSCVDVRGQLDRHDLRLLSVTHRRADRLRGGVARGAVVPRAAVHGSRGFTSARCARAP